MVESFFIWEEFLASLEEKLQMGLLGMLRGVDSAKVDDGQLLLEVSNPDLYEKLNKEQVLTQIRVLIAELVEVEQVTLCGED